MTNDRCESCGSRTRDDGHCGNADCARWAPPEAADQREEPTMTTRTETKPSALCKRCGRWLILIDRDGLGYPLRPVWIIRDGAETGRWHCGNGRHEPDRPVEV